MKADRPQQPKRFYKAVSVRDGAGGIEICLDGRPIRTPAGALFTVPGAAVADRVAEEWRRQGETIDIQGMHLTRLANVAIDRTPASREALADEVSRYCETDLTCFLASEWDVRARQEAVWKPWRTWAGQTLGIVLVPVEGLIASPQPAPSLSAARTAASALDDFTLTGLAFGCGLYGSAVLTFAVSHGALDADAAFDASVIDETIQTEQWGEDAEAQAAQAAKRAESQALGDWFTALSTDLGPKPES